MGLGRPTDDDTSLTRVPGLPDRWAGAVGDGPSLAPGLPEDEAQSSGISSHHWHHQSPPTRIRSFGCQQ